VAALGIFFLAGAIISFASTVSLLWPGGPLEPMWRINPRAREGFAGMGPRAPLLLVSVCVACASSALGLWRGRRWGHRLAIVVLSINLVGDAINALFGHDPRAAVGVPIAGALIAYLLSDRVRPFFRSRRVTDEDKSRTGL
jgi:hypothetical protein